jgi:hypothetical protein
MFWQLHHVLNSVRVSFQRSWPESWAESWLFSYWSCEAAREAAHEAASNGSIVLWKNYDGMCANKKSYWLTRRNRKKIVSHVCSTSTCLGAFLVPSLHSCTSPLHNFHHPHSTHTAVIGLLTPSPQWSPLFPTYCGMSPSPSSLILQPSSLILHPYVWYYIQKLHTH